jgi:hypothetical protein
VLRHSYVLSLVSQDKSRVFYNMQAFEISDGKYRSLSNKQQSSLNIDQESG